MTQQRLVVLSGAGISAESGLSTFRDNDGLWMGHRPEDVASVEGWHRNPQLVLDFYAMRRREASQAKPNEAHRILAELERSYSVSIVTQNVDDLHERAGSSHVVHLHGELSKNCSTRHRHIPLDVTPTTSALHVGDLAPDGGQLRPYIVWFGEEVPMFPEAVAIVEQADILVVVGTSLAVYPAASLVQYAPAECPIYVVDPKPVTSPYRQMTWIEGSASQGLARLREQIQL